MTSFLFSQRYWSSSLIKLHAMVMSVLQFLPKIYSWGNTDKISISNSELSYNNDDDEDNDDDDRDDVKMRRKISYWSNEYKPPQFGNSKHLKSIDQPEFITRWRPQTTFGFMDDFDIEFHKKQSKKSFPSYQIFNYNSPPQFIRR